MNRLGAPRILTLCDRIVGEIGRRNHLFAWLHVPGSEGNEWLAVNAYYPRNRLVVVCQDAPGPHDQLYAELVPAHGLRLLALSLTELGEDPLEIDAALRQRIADLRLPPHRAQVPSPGPRAPRDGAMARMAASLAQAIAPTVTKRSAGPTRAAATDRAARFIAASVRSPGGPGRNVQSPGARAWRAVAAGTGRPSDVDGRSGRAADGGAGRGADGRSRRAADGHAERSVAGRIGRAQMDHADLGRGQAAARVARHPALSSRAAQRHPAGGTTQALGMLIGLVLTAIVCIETYLGVVRLGLDSGRWFLAMGIVLDACSRLLGTVAAGRAKRTAWAWGCAIVGSPAVAMFTLFGREGRCETEPGPLAGLLSVLAIGVIALGVIGGALGF